MTFSMQYGPLSLASRNGRLKESSGLCSEAASANTNLKTSLHYEETALDSMTQDRATPREVVAGLSW
jgi:hypothetical protein